MSTQNETKEFVVSRTFDAPRDVVFKAWTESEQLAQWWGPAGFKIEIFTFDLRPGGLFHYAIHLPDGSKMWGRFAYREVTPPEKIVFVSSFSDEQANVTRAFFSQSFPLEILNNLTLTEYEGKTTVMLRGGPLNATDEEQKFYESMFQSLQQGFSGTFDQLEKHLATVNKS